MRPYTTDLDPRLANLGAYPKLTETKAINMYLPAGNVVPGKDYKFQPDQDLYNGIIKGIVCEIGGLTCPSHALDGISFTNTLQPNFVLTLVDKYEDSLLIKFPCSSLAVAVADDPPLVIAPKRFHLPNINMEMSYVTWINPAGIFAGNFYLPFTFYYTP